MRNSGCVPGHSNGVATHQSRGGEALLLKSLSSYASPQEQTTGRQPTGAHTITFRHTPSRTHWKEGSAYSQTLHGGRNTGIFTWLKTHIWTVKHYKKSENKKHSGLPLGDKRSFFFKITSFFGHSRSVPFVNTITRTYTIQYHVSKVSFLPSLCLHSIPFKRMYVQYVLYCVYREWSNELIMKASLSYMSFSNRV